MAPVQSPTRTGVPNGQVNSRPGERRDPGSDPRSRRPLGHVDPLDSHTTRFGAVRQPVTPPGAAAGSRTRDAFSELQAALDELSATLDEFDRTLAARTDRLRRLRDDRRPAPPDDDLDLAA